MRGNESLPLVKRIAVPNTKPQEIAEITTMIQSPAVAGRYSAGFRLEKNGQRFGPKLFVDVCTLAENENENENENAHDNKNKNEPEHKEDNKISESKPVIVKCTCGVPMIETSPVIAYYESAEVHCDLCGNFCPMSSTIYHCEKNEIHPNGYDLCSNCANSQIESFEQPKEEQPQKEEPKDTQKSQEQRPPQEESPQKPSQDQKNNEPQNQSNEEEVILLNNDPLSEFAYAQQARSIVEMGFNDIEKIKQLLISKKGNINEVLIALLS
jgi:FtsZ-interacting cell division protein YlmF